MADGQTNKGRAALATGIVLACLALLIGVIWWMERAPETGSAAKPPATQSSSRAQTKQFMDAADKGDTDKLKSMLAQNPKLALARQDGASALHFATWSGKRDAVILLAEGGSDLEYVETQHHGTALQWAVVAGRLDMAQLLMDRGAKANQGMVAIAEGGARGEYEDFAPMKREAYPAVAEFLRTKGVVDTGQARFLRLLREPEMPFANATLLTGPAWSADVAAKMNSGGNLLGSMSDFGCTATRTPDGIELENREDDTGLLTTKAFTSPAIIEIEAMTDSTNLRLYFGMSQLIFNWERKMTELRLIDPASGEWIGAAAKGKIPAKQWVKIQWVISAKDMKILVDGEERYHSDGDYAGIIGRVGIGPAWKAKVTVRSVKVKGAGDEGGL